MEGSSADNEVGSGVGSNLPKRKSSRSNSIIFKTVPENSRFESSEDDSSADGSLAFDELDGTQRKKQQPARSSDAASPSQRRDLPDGTQKQATVFSAVKRFTTQLSSLGFQSTSGENSPHNNRRSLASVNMRDRSDSSRINTIRRSSALSACTASASVVSPGEQQPNETFCLPDGKINALISLINHAVWRYTTGFFVFVMLFGAPIQDLFLPASADVAVDVIFTLAFVTLMLDILIRCIVDKAYFAWDRVGTSLTPRKTCKRFNTHCGSFMFWCDMVGTLTFIYDLSYINTLRAKPFFVYLEDKKGFSLDSTDPLVSISRLNVEILIVIGRTARLARPIRSNALIEGMLIFFTRSAKLVYLTPSFWLRRLASLQNYRRKRSRNETSLAHASERVLVGSNVSNPGNMFSLGDTKRGSSTRNSLSMVRVTEEQDSELSADQKKRRRFCFPRGSNLIPREIRRKSYKKDGETDDESGAEIRQHHSYGSSKDTRSHVGATMQQLTGQRVALMVFVAFLLNVLCSWQLLNKTQFMAMSVLHGQTSNTMFAKQAVDTARRSVIPDLYFYKRGDDVLLNESLPANLRQRDLLYVNVTSTDSGVTTTTTGHFNIKRFMRQRAFVEIMTTLFIILVWLLGIVLFVGPVMILVVEPIERMVRLLGMIMKDPLGYANTKEYRDFMQEEEYFAEHSMWGKDVLGGMETKFLMSTLLRIGSLMKVGFGSAGVEIIRNNLERGRKKDVLELSRQGTTVSCIFLFCDIRQFTDATECLQEEVFVFTNKIAAVVHSICNSYGGTANKNIGDAFLVSWLLDDDVDRCEEERKEEEQDMFAASTGHVMFSSESDHLIARNNQADKALLAVVKISISLHYDHFFVETMQEEARNRLLTKLSKRKGPIVQMGFGLHAGKAVQGAIGSPRKLDATYISESVERAEFLESSTKTYGVPLLMSETFFSLLDSANKYRCRRLDQLILLSAENDSLVDPREILDSGEKMSIYTFDMDIDALWKVPSTNEDDGNSVTSNSDVETRRSLKKSSLKRRSSVRKLALNQSSNELGTSTMQKQKSRRISLTAPTNSPFRDLENVLDDVETPEPTKKVLVLPTGVSKYSDKSWTEPDIKAIRHDLVTKGVLFPKFDDGLKSYIAKDWEHAKKCFETVLSQRDDGPSRYFLKCIEKHGGKPPRDFIGYKIV
mmetsp:Transcript_22930/g.37765  ORF Transcript_22930/g.37765 Transcript_22930/m.37765 type:complete len:1179 (-) Transcript_22930:80-3616(-)